MHAIARDVTTRSPRLPGAAHGISGPTPCRPHPTTPRRLGLWRVCVLAGLLAWPHLGAAQADAGNGSLRANLLQDPGFEDGPPRVLTIPVTAGPWTGEEDDSGFVVQGDAHSGHQFVRFTPSPGSLNEASLTQRFATTPHTDYTATCWVAGDPAVGLGDDAHLFVGIVNDPPCPVDVCDDDGDEDVDRAVMVVRLPLAVQTTEWVPVTATFNSGDATHMFLQIYSVLHDSQFWQVDDCSVTEEPPATADTSAPAPEEGTEQ